MFRLHLQFHRGALTAEQDFDTPSALMLHSLSLKETPGRGQIRNMTDNKLCLTCTASMPLSDAHESCLLCLGGRLLDEVDSYCACLLLPREEHKRRLYSQPSHNSKLCRDAEPYTVGQRNSHGMKTKLHKRRSDEVWMKKTYSKGSNTSNMIQHLRDNHPALHAQVKFPSSQSDASLIHPVLTSKMTAADILDLALKEHMRMLRVSLMAGWIG
ncbi:hypothetical protein ABVT39_023092 [Epinephelus coioides]